MNAMNCIRPVKHLRCLEKGGGGGSGNLKHTIFYFRPNLTCIKLMRMLSYIYHLCWWADGGGGGFSRSCQFNFNNIEVTL